MAKPWLLGFCSLRDCLQSFSLGTNYRNNEISRYRKRILIGRLQRVENLNKLVEIFDGPNYVPTRWLMAKTRLKQLGNACIIEKDKRKIPDTAYRLLDFFEHVSRLVNQNYIDAEGAWSEFYEWILMYGMDFDSLIDIERQNKSDPTYYENFTNLCTKLYNINKQKAGASHPPTKEELRDFYEMEHNALENLPGCKD